MSIAVVFDSAGTLLNTFRTAKNIIEGRVYPDIETTILTFADPFRVLCVLNIGSHDLIEADADMLLSTFLVERKIGFGIACTRRVVDMETIWKILESDLYAKMSDIQECIRDIWSKIKDEPTALLNSGVIIHTRKSAIEFTVTTGGVPFPGARATIRALHQMGVPTFIASGDRETKLSQMADYLGIPRDRVYGIATPTIKQRIITDLQEMYDQVIMVGDSINDLLAMRQADIAILSDQQGGEKPKELLEAVDMRINNIKEVAEVVSSRLKDLTKRESNSRS